MKRFIAILFLMLSFTMPGFAQETETAKPLHDMEVERKVARMDIEGEIYNNVVVTMKSVSPDYYFTDKYKVEVTVRGDNGKKIWKKTLRNVFLYVFSGGQVQVGKQNFDQILIQKSFLTGDYVGWVREKEGVY